VAQEVAFLVGGDSDDDVAVLVTGLCVSDLDHDDRFSRTCLSAEELEMRTLARGYTPPHGGPFQALVGLGQRWGD
jgi:hypothetical protein